MDAREAGCQTWRGSNSSQRGRIAKPTSSANPRVSGQAPTEGRPKAPSPSSRGLPPAPAREDGRTLAMAGKTWTTLIDRQQPFFASEGR